MPPNYPLMRNLMYLIKIHPKLLLVIFNYSEKIFVFTKSGKILPDSNFVTHFRQDDLIYLKEGTISRTGYGGFYKITIRNLSERYHE